VTLANNISVTDFLNLGKGVVNVSNSAAFNVDTNALTLSGNISDVDGSHHGRIYLTTPTTLSGANTYSGGTYVEANTTITNNSGLGTGFVDIGYGANLTFTSASPAVSVVADAGNFISNAGTGNVVLNSGVNLTINGTSGGTFTGSISGAGAITKNGTAVQTFNGTNSFSGGVTLSGGTLSVSSINNGGSNGGLGAASNAAANLVFDGGTLQYTGATASTDRNFTINTGKTAIISVTSNILTMSGASTATNGALTKTNGGTLILSGSNLYTGTTSVNGGKLFVNGSLASSAVVVGSGATLGGTGTLSHVATINSGGHLAPGDSSTGSGVGTLTFTGGLTLQAGAIYDFQLGNSASDKIVVNGGTLAGLTSGVVTLNLTNSGGFTTGTYTLFDFTGATNSNFDAGDFSVGTAISGFSSSLAISGTTLVLTASAIPEPSTYAVLVGATALAVAAWRRRRVQVSRR
jgi:autotransporter-associated beta strand protein